MKILNKILAIVGKILFAIIFTLVMLLLIVYAFVTNKFVIIYSLPFVLIFLIFVWLLMQRRIILQRTQDETKLYNNKVNILIDILVTFSVIVLATLFVCFLVGMFSPVIAFYSMPILFIVLLLIWFLKKRKSNDAGVLKQSDKGTVN